jgi:hypothetical protein
MIGVDFNRIFSRCDMKEFILNYQVMNEGASVGNGASSAVTIGIAHDFTLDLVFDFLAEASSSLIDRICTHSFYYCW